MAFARHGAARKEQPRVALARRAACAEGARAHIGNPTRPVVGLVTVDRGDELGYAARPSRCLLLMVIAAVLGACEPIVDDHGNVEPVSTTPQADDEIDSAAIPGSLARLRCSDPSRADDDPEVFISTQGAVYRSALSQLGLADAERVNLPVRNPGDPYLSGIIPDVCDSQFQVAIHSASSTDNVIATIRSGPRRGRVMQVQLGSRRSCVPLVGAPGEAVVMTSRSLLVRTSDTCGATWNFSAIDAADVTDSEGHPLGMLRFDRQELYVDEESESIFVTVNLLDTLDGPATDRRVVLLRASTRTMVPQWETIADFPGGGVVVMTAVPNDGGASRLYLFRCSGGQPELRFINNPTTPGATVTQVDVLDAAPACDIVNVAREDDPAEFFPITNRIPPVGVAPTFAFTSLAGARTQTLRVVYPDVVDDRQIARVVNVTLGTVGSQLLTSAFNEDEEGRIDGPEHILWTNLIHAEGLQQSTAADDMFTQVLRFARLRKVTGTNLFQVTESFRVWSPLGGWRDEVSLDEYQMIPFNDLGKRAACGTAVCFKGDYIYGTFLDQVATTGRIDGTTFAAPTTMRFLTPWTRPDPTRTLPNTHIFSATISQQP